MLWIILSSIGFLILVALFSRIYFTCNYNYTQNENILQVSVSVYKLKFFSKNINLTNENKDVPSVFNDLSFDSFPSKVKYVFRQLQNINESVTLLLKNLHIHHLNWITNGGTGEAGTTGIASGGVWTVKGIIFGILAERSQMKCKPNIKVIPHFQYRYLHLTFDCIASIRLGQAIYALLKVIRSNNIKEKAFI